MKRQLISNNTLVSKIQQKYKLKNTVGYSLNAFLNYEHLLDILAHLLIGAEGTLAFREEAVLKTLPDNPYKTTGLYFKPLTINDLKAKPFPSGPGFPLQSSAKDFHYNPYRIIKMLNNIATSPDAVHPYYFFITCGK